MTASSHMPALLLTTVALALAGCHLETRHGLRIILNPVDCDDYLEKPGFTWTTRERPPFRLHAESGALASTHLDFIAARVLADLTHVRDLVHAPQDGRVIDCFLPASRARMKQLMGTATNGAAIPYAGLVFQVYGDELRVLGAHEICHLIAEWTWGEPESIWINEGLAVYADDQWQGRALHPLCAERRSQHALLPMADLIAHFSQYPEKHTYPQVGSFVKFLYEKYGVDALAQLWQNGDDAFAAIYHEPLAQLEAEWLGVLAKQSRNR